MKMASFCDVMENSRDSTQNCLKIGLKKKEKTYYM